MIGGIRKFAKSKWALVLLFIPLIVSFGIFGFQDPFSGVTGGGLSRVGDRQIHARDLSSELTAEIESIRVEQNRVVTQADAVREGIAAQVLGRLEYRNMILAYADKMGIRASKKAVADLVTNAAGFKDALGRFNLDAVRSRANAQNMSVADFEEAVRDDLTAGYVTSAAFSALKVPDILSLPVINFVGETRTMTVARLTEAAIPQPKAATDAELEAWYNSHAERFKQPERRRISVLSYSANDFLDRVSVTDEQVKAEYEKRIRDYSTPETRAIAEFTSTDRNAVQSFIDLSQQGVAIDEAMTRVTGLTRADRSVKPDEITDERYRNLLFGLPVSDKAYTVPIRLAEGQPWTAVLVKSVTPGIPQPFEQVADKVRHDLSLPDAQRLYEDESEKFRDAAGGQPLEEIGKQFGFPVIQLAPVDGSGRTSRGDQAQLLAGNPALAELFTLQVGQMTNLFEGDNTRAMYRLDDIIAPYTQPFAEVKPAVQQLYAIEQKQNAATKAANDMVAAVKAGTSFEQAAAASKLTVLPVVTTTRRGSEQINDQQALQGAFELKVGDTGVVPGQGGQLWVVRVDKVEAVTPAAAAMLRAQVAPEVSQSLQGDMREVFVRGLQKEVPITRDEVAIRQYFTSLAPEDS